MENKTTTTVKKPIDRKIQNKNFLILAAAGLVLFTIGIIAFGMGAFKSKEEPSKNLSNDMIPPNAKNTVLEEDKYKDFTNTPNNQGEAMSNFQSLNGETSYRNRSNENLSPEEIRAVNPSGNIQPVFIDKSKANENFQNKLRNQAAQNAYYANPNTAIAYKTKADLQEEKEEKEYKRRNMQAQEDVISIMKKNQNGTPNSNTAENRNNVKASQLSGFEKQMQEQYKYVDKYDSEPIAKENESNGASIHPVVSPNTIGTKRTNGFYNVSTKNQRSTYTANDATLAVVHGDADGIEVANGGTIKVRLLQNTALNIDDNNEIILPIGTLITGIANISNDRLMINISTVVIGNSIYPVKMFAYDLDGMPGLNVPDLSAKSRFRQQAGQNLTQPLSGGTFFGQGSIGRQVGSSVAVQLGQSAVQLGQTALQTRAQNVKVKVKSNYKILLKSDNLNSSFK
jgi:conjugative transposon TraM protein